MSLRIAERDDGSLWVEGELGMEGAEALAQRLAQLPPAAVTLHLWELDVLEGPPVAAMVSALRELAARAPALVLVGAPQLLAHNLYRVGALQGSRAVTLVEPREEEPYG